jgi:hypothetical protein
MGFSTDKRPTVVPLTIFVLAGNKLWGAKVGVVTI